MRVLSLDDRVLAELPHWSAAPRRGGRSEVVLRVQRAVVDELPAGLDAIVAASDLQGRELQGAGETPRLLGEALADRLAELSAEGKLPAPERVGVLLCGDLWADPASIRRGGLGDVLPVWRAFAARFRWVAGVLGNHDELGPGHAGGAELSALENAYLLDGDDREIDGLRIAGIGGLVGDPRRLHRKESVLFRGLLERLLERSPDLLLLHEPPFVDRTRAGNRELGETLELATEVIDATRESPPLVVCGHHGWDSPLGTLGTSGTMGTGLQVLNVDHRVVVLECPAHGSRRA